MGISTPVEERIKSEAEFGLFHLRAKIGKNKATMLREQGLDVTDLEEVNYFPRTHYISWKNANVDSDDIQNLDEKSDEYTLAQKLWIIAMKNQPISQKEKEQM